MCGKAEKKVSQHIQVQHKEVGNKERLEMSKSAPIAPHKGAVLTLAKEKEQPSIDSYFLHDDKGVGDGGDASQKGESLGGEELAREDSGLDSSGLDSSGDSGDDGETADGEQRGQWRRR